MNGISDPKHGFDAFLDMSKHHRERFNTRRSYEWKVNLALWAGLGVFGGTVARADVNLTLFQQCCIIVILLFVAMVYTLSWSRGVSESNDHDSRLGEAFAREAEVLACGGKDKLSAVYNSLIVVPSSKKPGASRKNPLDSDRSTWWWSNWSTFSEIVFTWCMVLLVVLALLGSSMSKKESKAPASQQSRQENRIRPER
jgi:hypothetical protein